MNYSPSKKNLIMVISLGTGVALVFIGFIYFLFSKINVFEEATYNSARYIANSDRVFRLGKEIEDLEGETALLNGFFLRPGEEAYFLEKVESLAKKSGVKLQTESVFDGKTPKDGFIPLQVGVRFNGQWSKASSFIKNLESMPYALEVSTININIDSEGIWSGTASLNVYKWPK